MKNRNATRLLQLLGDGVTFENSEKLLKKQLEQLSWVRSAVSVSVGEELSRAFPDAKLDKTLDVLSFRIDFTLIGRIPLKGYICSEELKGFHEPIEGVFFYPL